MVYSYYPGCTLKNKAKDLDEYARESAKALDFELEEIENWQCCGAVYPMAKNETAAKLPSIRALNDAKEHGRDLVTLCSACHNVIKQVNHDMATDENIIMKANNYLELKEEYRGETKVLHYLEVLRDEIGYDAIKEKVSCPLKNKKIAAYYGCLLLRPSEVLQMDDPENPTIMEDLIKAMGATPVIYSQRNECCGGYVRIEDKQTAIRRSTAVIDDAVDKGAEMIITACPLCMYNLKNDKIPVKYFTELLYEALGLKEQEVSSDE